MLYFIEVMETYRSLGLISIVQLWVCLFYMIRRWPQDRSTSYSSHAAATRQGIIYYFVVFSLHMFLFYLFMVNWFVPTFHLPVMFTALLMVAILGQLAALIVPATDGRKGTIHDITAYTMHTLLMPLCLFIVFSGNFSVVARVGATIATAYMLTVWFLFTFVPGAKKHFLIFQTAYGLSFHLAIVLAIYAR